MKDMKKMMKTIILGIETSTDACSVAIFTPEKIFAASVLQPQAHSKLLIGMVDDLLKEAGIELSEAKKVVFIGYSLPQADFEMRQLLSRMIRKNAEIEVVDYGIETDQRIAETIKRYNTFFGVRKPKFYLKGAKDYIENHLD